MGELLTANEIASLIGGGCAPQTVKRWAARAGLKAETTVGQGGNNAYFWHKIAPAIPVEKRVLVAAKLVSVAACGSVKNAGLVPASFEAGATPAQCSFADGAATGLSINELPSYMRDRAVARSTVLSRLSEFRRHANMSETAAREAFATLYNSGKLDCDSDILKTISRVSAPTLKRWAQELKRGGLISLAIVQGGGNRRGMGLIETTPAVADLVIAMLTHFGMRLQVPRVVEAIAARFPDVKTPSRGAVKRFIRGWRAANPSLALALHNPDRWKGSHRIKIADAGADIVRLNQRWEIDPTPGDIELIDGRYQILTIIDIYSRRVMFEVAPSESSHATIQLICRAMLAWGVPEQIGGDNSRAFLSKHSQAFLADIDVDYDAARFFTPQDKGYVESVQGVMSHELLPMLPGFCGHNVSQRQELRARTSFAARFGAKRQRQFEAKLTRAKLRKKLNVWADCVHGDRPHSAFGKPPNRVAAIYPGERRQIGNERALAMVAEAAVLRVLGREGVKIANARFLATAETISKYVEHVGQSALCYPDPAGDAGRYFVFLDSPAGREFLCIVEDVRRLGYDRSNLAMVARAAQDKFIRERRAEMRRIKNRIRPQEIINAHLALAAERHVAAELSADAIIHETAALAAASAAFEPPALPKPWSPEELAELEEFDLQRQEEDRLREDRKSRDLSDDEFYGAYVCTRDSIDPKIVSWRQSFERCDLYPYFTNWNVESEKSPAEWAALGESGLRKLRAEWAADEMNAEAAA
jgi:putative transposase